MVFYAAVNNTSVCKSHSGETAKACATGFSEYITLQYSIVNGGLSNFSFDDALKAVDILCSSRYNKSKFPKKERSMKNA